jgi:MFS family permease
MTPTRARHVVTAFAVTLAVITYIDRVSIAVAAPSISADLGLSSKQMAWALAAFAWAYAVFEIPGGWLGDRIGPRRVLMRIVLWWSLFTAATGWAWRGRSLSESDAGADNMASRQGSRARPGYRVARHAGQWGIYTAAHRRLDEPHWLAKNV